MHSRVLQLLSSDLDADSLSMAQSRGAETVQLRVEPNWATVARAALALRRLDPRHDTLHTFGEPALRAALLGWRRDLGPIVHTRGWYEKPVSADVTVVDPVGNPTQGGCAATREVLRKRLRAGPDELLIWAPGRVHRSAGHRLAAWAMAILYVRNQKMRLLIGPDGDVESIRKFMRNNRISRCLVESPSLDDAQRAAACDAAFVCANTDRFERLPARAAVHAGVPVYASPVAATVLRAHGVITIDPPKARLFARAIVERFEAAAMA
jgi:hypothetical protein